MKFNNEQFYRLKSNSEEFYKSLGEVFCPYFKEKIIFNSKGLEHLKFKTKNHARSQEDQYIRLKLLHLAPEILKLSNTVQGFSERKVFELNRKNHRNEKILVDVIYYEFVAVLQKARVRVILKKTGTAPKYFWSIIPFWKVNKITGKRKMNYGNPEHD
ncbi:hypothetical protein COW81_00340 [Candidatus Campbellbacteria bacterium CG22_combo_CG10-13_8_21_14_all_36_13]|uniref:Phage-Barnase-EndoU-ColicinE5/D-RelE like nuclease 3 domain-containing protein n=1 Tax=Candidatus Campbellbacteria bacterium CG22_combo_CG10-13_8_21_14_all_36_13 TaxID=1974529 RepID=A0A2H0DZ21_9BACT|nr:MAG: hypothetical protein COW81_00340 [Candidatus Campbellbacteria bacterium CG22_combo_CG10-13_8_21_14_all_36_13]